MVRWRPNVLQCTWWAIHKGYKNKRYLRETMYLAQHCKIQFSVNSCNVWNKCNIRVIKSMFSWHFTRIWKVKKTKSLLYVKVIIMSYMKTNFDVSMYSGFFLYRKMWCGCYTIDVNIEFSTNQHFPAQKLPACAHILQN